MIKFNLLWEFPVIIWSLQNSCWEYCKVTNDDNQSITCPIPLTNQLLFTPHLHAIIKFYGQI